VRLRLSVSEYRIKKIAEWVGVGDAVAVVSLRRSWYIPSVISYLALSGTVGRTYRVDSNAAG